MSGRIIILVLSLTTAHALIDDALEVIKLATDVGEKVLETWEKIGGTLNITEGLDHALMSRKERQVISQLTSISRSMEKLEIALRRNGDIALMLANKVSNRASPEFREMANLLGRIVYKDKLMKRYMKLQKRLERSTLENFAQWCVAHDAGALPDLLERVHLLLVPVHSHVLGQSLFDIVLKDFQEDHPELCDLQMSPHQLIYDMYNTVSLTEIKGYAMMQFSWMLLKIYGKGNFTQEASLTRQRYGERAVKTAYAAKMALEMASRDFHRCDPISHVEGVTYDEVTRLLQGYIENEVDLNAEGTCKENCAHYTYAEKHRSFAGFSQQQPPCRGKVINCEYIDSDMIICPSNNAKRRYDWIEYENGRQLGQVGSCRNRKQVDSWWRWLFWHCSYCMCYCDDDKNSDRYFSLQEAVVNSNNKVLTGVKLVKKDRVFYLQVTEGTLGPRGSVTPGETLPVKTININDHSLINGRDYHMLTFEKRAIDLDQLESPAGSVLTGVRFRRIGAHLHFEILSTPFNYTTGILYPERSQWISNDNTEGADRPRKQLHLVKPDIPTRNHKSLQLPVDSTHDQYIEFVNTDLDADAAQSTVPFIDIQDVKPLKGASLLSGAGLVHKGRPGSGGFIALTVTTYDYSKHVHAEPPPDEEEPEMSTELDMVVN